MAARPAANRRRAFLARSPRDTGIDSQAAQQARLSQAKPRSRTSATGALKSKSAPFAQGARRITRSEPAPYRPRPWTESAYAPPSGGNIRVRAGAVRTWRPSEHSHATPDRPGHDRRRAHLRRRFRPRAGRGVGQGELHQVRVPHPHARRRAAVHRRLRPQGRVADVPDPAHAHAVQLPALRRRERTRTRLGPSASFARDRYIFVYQDVRGRWMSEGEFVNMRPHKPREDGPQGRRREHRHLRHDRLAGQERAAATTARSACGASRTPASTRRRA